uniref:Uncharacterized protein n=1 Tax=Cacopsylla melanoneura TaxID=428564 RepID=A0A8D8W5P0_9HEMI
MRIRGTAPTGTRNIHISSNKTTLSRRNRYLPMQRLKLQLYVEVCYISSRQVKMMHDQEWLNINRIIYSFSELKSKGSHDNFITSSSIFKLSSHNNSSSKRDIHNII